VCSWGRVNTSVIEMPRTRVSIIGASITGLIAARVLSDYVDQVTIVAALEGLALRDCVAEAVTLENVWHPFIKKASRIVDTPWMIAAGSDFAFPRVTGPKPAGTDLVNWYLERVHRAASRDRDVCRAFFDVANLLVPAARLFHPAVAARVFRDSWRNTPVSEFSQRYWLHGSRQSTVATGDPEATTRQVRRPFLSLRHRRRASLSIDQIRAVRPSGSSDPECASPALRAINE
jgi:hypothetical protein